MGKQSGIYVTTSGGATVPVETYLALGTIFLALAFVFGIPTLYLYGVFTGLRWIYHENRFSRAVTPFIGMGWVMLNAILLYLLCSYAYDYFNPRSRARASGVLRILEGDRCIRIRVLSFSWRTDSSHGRDRRRLVLYNSNTSDGVRKICADDDGEVVIFR